MTLSEILNTETDFRSLAAAARRGFDWWVSELAALLPQAWREGLGRRTLPVAEPRASGGWRMWRDGRPLAEAEPVPGGSVALALPADAVFTRELRLPRMSRADLRLLVAMDLDRLSPLDPALVHHDVEVLERDGADGAQAVLLGVAPRAAVAEAVERADAEGLRLGAVGLQSEADPSRVRFDFLPAHRAETGLHGERRIAAYAWAGLAALLLANLALLIARDVADTAKLRGIVAAQAPAVNAELRLRARVEAEEARRARLLDPGGGGRPDLVRTLNALAEALPPAAWAQRLEWNGRAVRLTGYAKPGTDVLAAVRASPIIAAARSLASPAAAAPATVVAVAPFDIGADIAPARVAPPRAPVPGVRP